MIKPWLFEFLHETKRPAGQVKTEKISDAYQANLDQWIQMEALDYEGFFFSEHHFENSYSP